MGFYSISWADYLHSSPIITCTTDSDRIISVHYVVAEIALSACHLLYCLGARWFLPQWSLTSEWPPCGAHASESAADVQCGSWARGWRTTTIQNTRFLARSLSKPRAHGGARPSYPTQYLLCARVYLWRSPGRIYDWSTKARDSPPYPIFGCLRKRESSPCPTHFHNSS